MFWDYLRARLSLIIGVLIGLLIFILLILYSNNMWAIIGFLPLYLILLRSFVKKVAIKTMHDLEKSLYKDLDVLNYASKYDYLAKNGVTFDERWTVTKYQNALLGNLFLGDRRKTEGHINYLEENYKDFYKKNPLFKYMFEVLKTLHSLFYENPQDFKQNRKTMINTFGKLPEEVKKQIKGNEESFHNWIQWNEKNVIDAKDKNHKNLLKTIKQMPKLNAVGSYYLLKKEDPDFNDSELENYLQNVFIADPSQKM
ncbi:MAG: hypothetical protein ACLFQE_08065 [Thermotogota bacterium]